MRNVKSFSDAQDGSGRDAELGALRLQKPAPSAYPNSSSDFTTLDLDHSAHNWGPAWTEKAGLLKAAAAAQGHGEQQGGGRPPQEGQQAAESHSRFSEEELRQTDKMIDMMILSYLFCLAFGWGLLFLDWFVNYADGHPKSEPWINDTIIIGCAAATLSPVIQWSTNIHAMRHATAEVVVQRRRFYAAMLGVYVAMITVSSLVATARYAAGEDGSLHHYIANMSNHLVLARVSASLLSWVSSKLFIRWYRARLHAGPLL